MSTATRKMLMVLLVVAMLLVVAESQRRKKRKCKLNQLIDACTANSTVVECRDAHFQCLSDKSDELATKCLKGGNSILRDVFKMLVSTPPTTPDETTLMMETLSMLLPNRVMNCMGKVNSNKVHSSSSSSNASIMSSDVTTAAQTGCGRWWRLSYRSGDHLDQRRLNSLGT
ncbi:hypothetical protein Hamer_G019940 [Homarus americanus]|uniref:Uncharacterized protein n=1 Tax=Homarus americanus TaxID=6706 RepID=A0A8J5JQ00_HOMAM|nr:hypothetical protein Hamer_G019940 [Homarus americanus]